MSAYPLIVALAMLGTASGTASDSASAPPPAPPPAPPRKASAGKYEKNFEVNIKEAALLSIDAMNFEGEVETQVSDQIAAGASYDQNSGKFAPKTLFTRWTAKGGDPFKATATYNVAAATAEVDVEYEKFGSTFSAKFNSARETLITAADACRDFTVDGRKLKLAPSHDFVSGVSSLKSNLALSDDTSVELKLNSDNIGNSDALTGTLSVDHNIDKINSIKHTFALDSGAATHEFRRTLDGDAKFSVAASPGHSVEVEWDEASSKSLWTTNVRMPWGQYDRASVSFKRKFKV